jgi:TPR repeat protein
MNIFRCSSAYKLFKQAADLGHIEAKEELAFAHLIGVHLPMNFNQAMKYFEEGVLTGSPKSHFVRSNYFLYCF